MGIRKYHNQWRACFTGDDGTFYQEYFLSEKAAKQFMERKAKNRLHSNQKVKKRLTATHQDLPVGLYQLVKRKRAVDGDWLFHDYMAVSVYINGEQKIYVRAFGRSRTREQAIKLCVEWREKMLKEKARQNKRRKNIKL